MRRQHRGSLATDMRLELRKLGKLVTDVASAREEWNRFLARNSGKELRAELIRMARIRNRCAYCDDSRAADVDHFWPLSPHYTKAFEWHNHLWSCPECNRRKSARFPVVSGVPLLVNPVEENWWDFLTLDTGSGVLAPRFDAAGHMDPRGAATLDVFRPLTYEPVIEGRFRSIERLRKAAQKTIDMGDAREAEEALGQAITHDDFDVAAWFALGPGAQEEPFATLTKDHCLWRRFVRLTVRQQHTRA
jgi:hypothetical protein